MTPLFVMVPSSAAALTSTVPLLVRLLRIASPFACITPVPAVVMVPPVKVLPSVERLDSAAGICVSDRKACGEFHDAAARGFQGSGIDDVRGLHVERAAHGVNRAVVHESEAAGKRALALDGLLHNKSRVSASGKAKALWVRPR